MLQSARVVLGTLILLLFNLANAQQSAPPSAQGAARNTARAKVAAEADPKAAPKISEEQKLGLQLLESSEAASRGFEPPMRSYLLLQVGSSLATIDAPRTRRLLRESFTASLGIRDDNNTKITMQLEIFRALVPLSQADAEELLPQAETRVRNPISELIVSRYVEKKEFDKALDLINQLSAVDEFPYGCASRVMDAMPPEMSTEKQNLFSQAVTSYKNHEHPETLIGGPTLTGLITRFGMSMPPKLVLLAIDEILSQAKAKVQTAQGDIRLRGPGGSASFASDYQFQLFALLPTLQKLDESRAKQLLDENQDLQGKLQQFPDGMNSLMPPPQPGNTRHVQSTTTIESRDRQGAGSGIGKNPGAAAGGSPLPAMDAQHLIAQEAQRRAQDIAQEGETDPTQAIAHSMTLPLKLDESPMITGSPRARTLEAIARANVEKNPGGAADALRELRKIVVDLPPQLQAQYLATAGDLYMQMKDADDAGKVVSEGFKVAEKLLAADTNAEDPNTALKAWWPSTDAYRRFVELETKISPHATLQVLKEIDDREIMTTESIIVARTLLGQPMQRFSVAEKRKGNASMSTFNSN